MIIKPCEINFCDIYFHNFWQISQNQISPMFSFLSNCNNRESFAKDVKFEFIHQMDNGTWKKNHAHAFSHNFKTEKKKNLTKLGFYKIF